MDLIVEKFPVPLMNIYYTVHTPQKRIVKTLLYMLNVSNFV